MKFHATLVCVGNPQENYACLYVSGTNDSVESCTDQVADYAPPGKRYVLKENPDTEYCSKYKYQPYKLWSNSSSDCEFLKDECSEIGQIMCNLGSTLIDRTCRCNHKKGYAFVTPPRNSSFCMPAEEDCSCYLKICKENQILAPDYKCKPSQDSHEHIPCQTLPDQDDEQVTASLPDYTVHIEDRRNIYNLTNQVDTIIITIIIIIICLGGIIYISYNLFYTPLDTVEVFTNKIRRNYKKLKTSINQQTEDQLVINGFLTNEQKDNFKHKDEILIFIARNSKEILKTYRRKSLRCLSKHDELIGKILKTDFIDLIDLQKPSGQTTERGTAGCYQEIDVL
ncbi:Hypothetical predicted protein [Mytilus galloprovincialis]|nr:Hypothetical predicted protein [Mytilus galloprovincialis]